MGRDELIYLQSQKQGNSLIECFKGNLHVRYGMWSDNAVR